MLMPDDPTSPVQWIGWGVGAVVLYLVVSNTLYLLVGARLLQFLPGVNIKGFRGTIRLALLLVITVIATAWWLFKWSIARIMRREPTSWRGELANCIHIVARISNRMTDLAARRTTPR